MEKDVEARLKEKYALIDKNDAKQMAEAQKAGLANSNDDATVGDTDGQSFGIGLAPRDSRASRADLVNVTKRNRSRVATKSTT